MRFVVLGLLTVTFCRAGGELPVIGERPALSYQPEPRLAAPPARPVAEVLAAMSPAEKANARLQLPVDAPEAREAEALWNSGDWGRALALVRMLEPEAELARHAEVAGTFRTRVLTGEQLPQPESEPLLPDALEAVDQEGRREGPSRMGAGKCGPDLPMAPERMEAHNPCPLGRSQLIGSRA